MLQVCEQACNNAVNSTRCNKLVTTSLLQHIIQQTCHKLLKHRTIKSVNKLLKVVGVTGQNVQFLGYFEVDIKFPEEESGVKTSQPALAIVVPDTEYNKRVPLVIGTNVAQRFKDQCHQRPGDQFLRRTRLSSAWRKAYKALQSRQQFAGQCENGKIKVRSTSRRPITIESHQTVVIWGITQSLPDVATKVILEPQAIHPGVTTTQGLITLSPTGTKCRVPVELTNTIRLTG